MSPLILLPAKTDPVPEERHDKRNLDGPYSSSSSKIVLALLTKVVAVHVGLSAVYIWETDFQLFPVRLQDNKSWSGSKSKSGNGSESFNL